MFSRISILIFDEVEILDFSGPLEVFNNARSFWNAPPPSIELVSPNPGAIHTVGNMRVLPDRTISECLHTDLLVIPGGKGTRKLLQEPRVIQWIIALHAHAHLTLSICTGALLLGKARLLHKREATTHHTAIKELRHIAPSAHLRPSERSERFVDTGDIITAAGISAGIDAALYTVARISGSNTARKTAEEMEYDWPRSTSRPSIVTQ